MDSWDRRSLLYDIDNLRGLMAIARPLLSNIMGRIERDDGIPEEDKEYWRENIWKNIHPQSLRLISMYHTIARLEMNNLEEEQND